MASVSAVPPVVIGIDLGTSSAKAVAFDRRGTAVASHSTEVALHTDGDRAEQDQDALVEAVVEATAAVTGQLRQAGEGRQPEVRAIALSAAMHAVLAVDGRGQALTPVIGYADNRAAEQATWLRRAHPELAVRTGTPVHAMSPLAKLRWFSERDPDLARSAVRWVSPKEHLLHTLCGRWVIDRSLASTTGLYALREGDWDATALELAGVDSAQLSTVVPTTTVLDGIDPRWAARLGLSPATPVVVGAADGCLANLGAGAVDVDTGCLTLGTSGAVRVVTDQPRTDPDGALFCYVLTEDRWVVGGPVSNGGVVLRWARERLLPELAAEARRDGVSPYARFDQLAASVPSGADGLLFLPHLLGERAPVWDPELRAALLGLSASHGRAHVLRALLEGVAYQVATVVDVMAKHGIAPSRLRANGGFTASPLWVRIHADVLGRPLEVVAGGDASCLGAALLARQALGDGDALALAREVVQVDERCEPDPAAARLHARIRPLFVAARADIAATSAALAELSRSDRDTT